MKVQVQKIGILGPPLGTRSEADPQKHAPPNTCYHAKFGRIRSIDMSVLMEIGLKECDHSHLIFKGSLKVIGTDAV